MNSVKVKTYYSHQNLKIKQKVKEYLTEIIEPYKLGFSVKLNIKESNDHTKAICLIKGKIFNLERTKILKYKNEVLFSWYPDEFLIIRQIVSDFLYALAIFPEMEENKIEINFSKGGNVINE